jgi:hypothetical protein
MRAAPKIRRAADGDHVSVWGGASRRMAKAITTKGHAKSHEEKPRVEVSFVLLCVLRG